jgi:hypothetical protein
MPVIFPILLLTNLSVNRRAQNSICLPTCHGQSSLCEKKKFYFGEMLSLPPLPPQKNFGDVRSSKTLKSYKKRPVEYSISPSYYWYNARHQREGVDPCRPVLVIMATLYKDDILPFPSKISYTILCMCNKRALDATTPSSPIIRTKRLFYITFKCFCR